MIVHVVNLRRRIDRRHQFLEWNGRHALSYRFFDAVEGQTVDRAALVRDGILADDAEHFSAGAIGCALSHRRLWEICAASDEIGLIVEDDACIRNDFVSAFDAILRATDDPWDIMFVGYNTDGAMTIQPAGALTSFIVFDETAKSPSFFTRFATEATAQDAPIIADARLVWGTLGYSVTPHGAMHLIEHCFPMRMTAPVAMPFQGIQGAFGIDGMISSAMQRGLIAGKCCFPPLVLGPNDKATSDIRAAAACPEPVQGEDR